MNVLVERDFEKVLVGISRDELRANGLVVLWNKPAWVTSHDVVARIRKRLVERYEAPSWKRMGIKVGHAGTLDPLATGLLIVLIGSATKRQADYMKLDKEYVVKMWLGMVSDTFDIDGQVVRTKEFERGGDENNEFTIRREIESVLGQYRGRIQQQVPAYSAVKKNGKKMYELARHGKVIQEELPVRMVEITELQIVGMARKQVELEGESWLVWEAELKIGCSSGTYVRSLVHEIGGVLGVGAVVSRLKRTRIGEYVLDETREVRNLC